MDKERILITGGLGFLGSHLVTYILDNTNYDIVILDRIDISSNLNRIDKKLFLNDRVAFIWHDLKAEINNHLCSMLGNFDYIMHLAASSHVDRSIDNPLLFVMDNVVGTCNILEFARKNNNLKQFLYFSTDEVFGPAKQGISFHEWDRYNSGNPYSASKAGGEELSLSFFYAYGLPVTISHCMNMFGEKQNPEKFLPLLINKLLIDEEVNIHSNKDRTKSGSRYYLHAKDACSASHIILKKGILGEKYNITGGQELTNLELAELVAKYMQKNLKYKFILDRGAYDMRYDIKDNKLSSLGWNISDNIIQDIYTTIDWFLLNKEWL